MMNEKAIYHMLYCYEDKLREFMDDDEYMKFATGVARESFRIEVEEMENGDLKDFILYNFDKITEE